MKKGEKRAALLLGIALFVSLAIVAGIYFLSEPHLARIDESLTMDAGSVNSISVEAMIGSIVYKVGGDAITARLYGLTPSEPEFKAKLAVAHGDEPGTLIIREYRESFALKVGGGEELTLEITVPNSVRGAVTLSSSSGSISAEGIEAHFYRATTVSGDIELKNCAPALEFSSLGFGNASTVSGNIVLDNLTHYALNVSTTSGSVDARMLRGGNVTIEDVSGDIDINGVEAGELKVSSDSGGIDVTVARLGKEAMLDSLSGSIRLELPVELIASIDAGSVSGNVAVNRANSANGVVVTAATISGDITVE